jgi:succinoglycan biosynthesis protein ExoM
VSAAGAPASVTPPLSPAPGAPEAPATASPPVPAAGRVAICIATYRRPAGLRRLLGTLGALELPSDVPPPLVVVVDNDAAGSAEAVVAAAGAELPLELAYARAPERNIALARNRGVAVALERGAAWLAFVDDDEVAHPGWLRGLLRARDEFSADVVAGAIRSVCPPGTPGWLAHDRFYVPLAERTGAVLTGAYTGNVLVRAELLRGVPGPFDPRFGLSGGSDSHLFMRLHRAGARIVFTGEAVTEEIIPPARARASWVLRRAFRVGNTAMLCERTLAAGTPGSRLARATLRLGLGAVSLPLAAFRGRGAAVLALWNVCYGLGAFAGAGGIRYREYARPLGEE